MSSDELKLSDRLVGWKMRSSTWVLQLITLGTIQTIKTQLEIYTIHIIKESHLRLLENDRRQKKNGSMDHLLTCWVTNMGQLKKKKQIPWWFEYPSHSRTTYSINNILRQKRAKVAWSWWESFKAQDSRVLWLHLMSDFFHKQYWLLHSMRANTNQITPRTSQAQSHFAFLMKCTSN